MGGRTRPARRPEALIAPQRRATASSPGHPDRARRDQSCDADAHRLLPSGHDVPARQHLERPQAAASTGPHRDHAQREPHHLAAATSLAVRWDHSAVHSDAAPQNVLPAHPYDGAYRHRPCGGNLPQPCAWRQLHALSPDAHLPQRGASLLPVRGGVLRLRQPAHPTTRASGPLSRLRSAYAAPCRRTSAARAELSRASMARALQPRQASQLPSPARPSRRDAQQSAASSRRQPP